MTSIVIKGFLDNSISKLIRIYSVIANRNGELLSLSRVYRTGSLGLDSTSATGSKAVSTFPANFWHEKSRKPLSPKYTNMATLETMNFDNLALKVLPLDPVEENCIRQAKGACFSLVDPTPVKNPVLVAAALPALALLDLSEDELKRPEFIQYFSGNEKFKGSKTAAHCYCGHQFGNFAGQLGDGAAIYLGEIINKKEERWEIQLKGAGKTPFSRQADGRKVLRSSIREFLCSEAMHYLGVPTTRAATCVTSDSKVIRDIFYSGTPIQEKCTIVCRLAETFIRFGSFEICKPPDRMTGREGPSVGRHDVLQQLTEYVIKTFYPEVWETHKTDKVAACKSFFEEIVRRTAQLVALWQCVGWCHGVLNTDNMSIVGLTMDYGPYGFMDRYDPEFICNGSDDGGRYTYKKQPEVCKWNCLKLAEALALMPHIDREMLTPILDVYDEEFAKHYLDKMRKKFGLKKEFHTDKDLVTFFMDTMEKTGADFTNSFRCLSHLTLPGTADHEKTSRETLRRLLDQCCPLEELIRSNQPRMDPRQLQMFLQLMEMNPQLLAQLGAGHKVIAGEIKRKAKVDQLKDMTQDVKLKEDTRMWKSWLDSYTERLKLETEGEGDLEVVNRERAEVMNSNNPRVILRNYIAQNAIAAAEQGDFTEVRRVLRRLQSPYGDHVAGGDLAQSAAPSSVRDETAGASAVTSDSSGMPCSVPPDDTDYGGRPPSWALDLRVT